MQEKVYFKQKENNNILGLNWRLISGSSRAPDRSSPTLTRHEVKEGQPAVREVAAPRRAFQTSVKPMTHFMPPQWKKPSVYVFHGGILVNMKKFVHPRRLLCR